MPENIDWDFISSLEGGRILRGYVPNASGSNSGVTIATGFDLGQRNASDLRNLRLSADLIRRFTPYLGLQGAAAVEALRTNPLNISEAEGREIDRRVKSAAVARLRERYRTARDNANRVAFDDLPSQAQTVIASVEFQYGNLSTETPTFWRLVSAQNWTDAVAELRNFRDGYPTRRNREADLLQQIVRAATKQAAEVLSLIKAWNFVFLVAFFGIACPAVGAQTRTVIFDADLAKAYQNFDQSAAATRPEITFESGAKADNCAAYWRARETSSVKETVADMLYKSEYLICDALRILRKPNAADGVSIDSKASANYGKEIYNRLDLTGFPSSRAQKFTEPHKTFAREPNETRPKIEPLAVVSDTKDWNFAVRVVAETDANDDGKKDLIVYIIDESKQGNLKNYSALIIYDVEKPGELKAVAPPTCK